MTRHPRIPAFLAILLTAGVGIALFAATGQFRTTDLANATLQDLEKRIVESTDGNLWMAYGDKLLAAKQPEPASKAYQRAITLQPDLLDARLNLGLALGQGRDVDAFFDYVGRLSVNYAKLADDLMRRPELGPLHGHPKWGPAAVAAQAQAID